ncbi:GON-4-like protein isoform X2 [Thalassophryne amazonica]|nr:GON-4-like protein isoform X2 [Thalassophryne amazonica]
MMKAAINETEAIPPFEPKMTRSKFKEVLEKGMVVPAWNISPIKTSSDAIKAPQFVDIPLAEEDSSDEEYRPDEEEEDETAEDTFHESDMESAASSPRGRRQSRLDESSCSPWQTSRSCFKHLQSESVPMGPPPPPKAPPSKAVTDRSFLEKLHAVEEELAVCMEPYQPLSESEDEAGLMAYRTRSKRPLRDVPLGRLEAELRAPDITPDMYDSNSAPEDREWTDWLRGLMTSDMENEEECDDEDDPEYNFLADIDEPDVEDYRDDKAVRITKKEVNELMEELFETLKEDLTGQDIDEEGHEEEDETQEAAHTLEEQHKSLSGGLDEDDPEDGPITGRQTVRQQLGLLHKRQQLGLLTNTQVSEPYTLRLDGSHKVQLQQQIQQHVQLLTQVHLLTSPVSKLHSEAETTRQFLLELDLLAQRSELLMLPDYPSFSSIFRASNLQGALQLLEELQQKPIASQPQTRPPDALGRMRSFPVMPAELAWIFATRPVFLYPELLPCVSLDPALYCPRRTAAFTAAEDCLLVLGLRNMEGSHDPTKLVSQFLLRKTSVQVRRRILQCCRPSFHDNIVKAYRYQRVLLPMPLACGQVDPADQRPPVERDESIMPLWLARSLPVIYRSVKGFSSSYVSAPQTRAAVKLTRCRHSHRAFLRTAADNYRYLSGTRYPSSLPTNLVFRRIGFVLIQETNAQEVTPPHHNPTSPTASHRADGQTRPTYSQPLFKFKAQSPPSSCPSRALSPTRVLLFHLLLKASGKLDNSTHISSASTMSSSNREQIICHYLTFARLRRRRRDSHQGAAVAPPSCEAPTSPCVAGAEEEDVFVPVLTLSVSSPSAAGSISPDDGDSPSHCKEAASPCESAATLAAWRAEEENDDGRTSNKSRVSEVNVQEASLEEQQREQEEQEDEVFAQDYLRRVCDAVQVCPSRTELLLQVLDQFSEAGPAGDPVDLFHRLSAVLRPWPQLLRDYAAFLNQTQARSCGLLGEQQLFEHTRHFLQQLGRSLGEGTAQYQEVVSFLLGNSAPESDDLSKVSSLLSDHPELQVEFWEFFQKLHAETDSISQNPPDGSRRSGLNLRASRQLVCAKNSLLNSSGEKVVLWTREADRTILTTCQQRGANQNTFRLISAQLGNKTAREVSIRFQDLMSLYFSASQTSASCSSKKQSIHTMEAAPD